MSLKRTDVDQTALSLRCLIQSPCFSSILPTVHIKEYACNRTSHTASHRRIVPRQPRLFQITQLFHASPVIHSQVQTPQAGLDIRLQDARISKRSHDNHVQQRCYFGSPHLKTFDFNVGFVGQWDVLGCVQVKNFFFLVFQFHQTRGTYVEPGTF